MFVFVLLATDLTELVLELNPIPKFRLCSLWEGVTLLFVVFLLSALARNDTKSASAATLLKVTLFRGKLSRGLSLWGYGWLVRLYELQQVKWYLLGLPLGLQFLSHRLAK